MCKMSNGFCSALEAGALDTRSPLKPLEWFDASIDSFVEAYLEARHGNLESAIAILLRTRSNELQTWMHIHAQNVGYWRADKVAPQTSAMQPRKVPASLEHELFARDGYRCRYCGIRVFPAQVMKTANALFGHDAFPIRGGNLQRHGIKLCFSATLDHVDPIARGGPNDASNLVTACWCCNYGKSAYSVKQLRIEDPRDFSPQVTSWRGLTDV